jgi:uncharacterized protein HemX
MNRTGIIAFLMWSIALVVGAFFYGGHVQKNADIADQAQDQWNESEYLRLKNRKAVAAGIRTEKAQAKTDQFFQQLRAEYETDQRKDPAIGCVLDPVSLRQWNTANAGPDGDAAGEPDAGVQPPAETDTR